MGEEIDKILEGYHQKEYDLIEVRKKLLILIGGNNSSSYEIDFDGHCKAGVDVTNGELKVIGAINGVGESIDISRIKIDKLICCKDFDVNL